MGRTIGARNESANRLIKLSIFFVGYLLKKSLMPDVLASDDEYRLLQDLKENYDPIERPVQNHSQPVDVRVKIVLQQIVDVDEKNQMLTIVVWFHQTWHDYKMRWNPEEYAGIKDIQLPSDMLWKPDLNFDARFPVNFVVEHTGKVVQAPPAILKSSCSIDITWFPFDEQVCFLKYGSWTYTARKLQLFIDESMLRADSVHSMDREYFIPNGEWELLATPAMRNLSHYENESYNELFFYLHIRRQTIYYGMNWIIPSILFLLSNVLGFTMPSECGEKITLQTTNLLSVTVFLGMVADITPPTSTSVPIIAAFFSISMVILGSSIIFTLLIINVHFRSPRTHKMSPWVRTMFLEWLPWLLLMTRPGKQFKKPKKNRKDIKKQSSADSPNFLCRDSAAHLVTGAQLRGGVYPKKRTQLFLRSQNSQSDPYVLAQRAESIVSMTNTRSQLSHSQFLRSDSPLVSAAAAGERHPLLDTAQQERENAVATSGARSSPLRGAAALINAASTASRMEKELGLELTSETTALLRKTLRELSDYLQISQLKMDEEEEEEEAKADWRFMAMALDRACLFFYALLSGMIPLWMFVSVPAASLPRQVFTLDDMIGNNTALTGSQNNADAFFIQ